MAEAIEEFRAERLAKAEYLTRVHDICDQVVRLSAGNAPEAVRGDELAIAVWRVADEIPAP